MLQKNCIIFFPFDWKSNYFAWFHDPIGLERWYNFDNCSFKGKGDMQVQTQLYNFCNIALYQ